MEETTPVNYSMDPGWCDGQHNSKSQVGKSAWLDGPKKEKYIIWTYVMKKKLDLSYGSHSNCVLTFGGNQCTHHCCVERRTVSMKRHWWSLFGVKEGPKNQIPDEPGAP